MEPRDLRALLIEALRAARVYDAAFARQCTDYVESATDVPLSLLDMDSLARMEFCIAIELATGVTVVPAELEQLPSLAAVEAVVRERMG